MSNKIISFFKPKKQTKEQILFKKARNVNNIVTLNCEQREKFSSLRTSLLETIMFNQKNKKDEKHIDFLLGKRFEDLFINEFPEQDIDYILAEFAYKNWAIIKFFAKKHNENAEAITENNIKENVYLIGHLSHQGYNFELVNTCLDKDTNILTTYVNNGVDKFSCDVKRDNIYRFNTPYANENAGITVRWGEVQRGISLINETISEKYGQKKKIEQELSF